MVTITIQTPDEELQDKLTRLFARTLHGRKFKNITLSTDSIPRIPIAQGKGRIDFSDNQQHEDINFRAPIHISNRGDQQ